MRVAIRLKSSVGSSSGNGTPALGTARQMRHSVSPSNLANHASAFAPLVGVVGNRASGVAARSVLWRVNFPRFLFEFRARAIMKLVGEKIDSTAKALVETALELHGSQPASSADEGKPPATAPFTVDTLLAKCPAHFANDWQLVCNYLDTMCHDPLCKMASTLNGKYILELAELGNAVKQLLLETVVRDLVGDVGCRIYRILLRKHAHGGCSGRGQQKLELKQLAEAALLPERDARPLVAKLLKAGYVMLQEVPRTADRNPKATSYLWHVSLPHAYRALETDMLSTLGNLCRRLEHELSAHGKPLDPPPCSVAGESASDTQRRQAQHAQLAARRVEVLENSILQLHDTVMMLRIL